MILPELLLLLLLLLLTALLPVDELVTVDDNLRPIEEVLESGSSAIESDARDSVDVTIAHDFLKSSISEGFK